MKKLESYFGLQIEILSLNSKSKKSPILYIHGLDSNLGIVFKSLCPEFADHPYYSLNYPGMDKSTYRTLDDFGLLFYAHLTIELIYRYQLKNIILIGDSIGGAIAALLVVLNPKLFSKVIYRSPINPFSIKYKNELKQLLLPKNIQEWEQAAAIYYHNFWQKRTSKKYLNQKIITITKLNNFSLYALGIQKLVNDCFNTGIMSIVDWGLKLTNKLYLVYGEHDLLVNCEQLIPHLHSINSSAKVFMINNAGHGIMKDNQVLYLQKLQEIINEN